MEEMQGSGVSISCAPLAALCPQISQYADNEPLEKKSRTDSVRMSRAIGILYEWYAAKLFTCMRSAPHSRKCQLACRSMQLHSRLYHLRK